MARKRKKKPPLRRLEKQADKALSEYIRFKTKLQYNNLCPLCGKDPLKKDPEKPNRKNMWVAFHFIRRRRKVLRWCEDNLTGACSVCNYVEYRNPDLSRAWYLTNRGVDLYLKLVEKSKEDYTPTREELLSIIAIYKDKLAQLKGKTDEPIQYKFFKKLTSSSKCRT